MDLATAPRSDLIAYIRKLEEKVATLEAQVIRLQQQFKGGQGGLGSPTPPFVKSNTKKKSKKKRKKREKAHTRKTEKPTKVVLHSLKNCPECQGELGKPSVAYKRQTLEIPQIRYEVIEDVILKRWCTQCQKRFTPQADFSDQVLGEGRIGLNLASMIATMKNRLRLPLGQMQQYLEITYDLHLSEGEIVRILHQVANLGQPRYDGLLEEIRESSYAHGDETSGREDGQNGWQWSLSTPKAHYLTYEETRSKTVVKKFFGEDSEHFEGVLVTDFYASYNAYLGEHQRCWVHLLRDIKKLQQENTRHPPLNIWSKKIRELYQEAKEYRGPPKETPAGLAEKLRVKDQRRHEERLRELCEPHLGRDRPMSTLCTRLMRHLPEMFMFIKYPEVPPENNHAERILRHTVVARKISGGTRSRKGSETHSILTSLFDTWQLQDKNPLEECRSMLASCQ